MNRSLFGERLNTLLDERGLTQREAAELMGVSHVCISRYIKGDRVPKITNVVKLAKGLGVTIDYLSGLSDEKKKRIIAHWEPEHHGGFSPGGNPLYRCSNCKWCFGTHMAFPNFRYCPDCGAKMEVEHDSQ